MTGSQKTKEESNLTYVGQAKLWQSLNSNFPLKGGGGGGHGQGRKAVKTKMTDRRQAQKDSQHGPHFKDVDKQGE